MERVMSIVCALQSVNSKFHVHVLSIREVLLYTPLSSRSPDEPSKQYQIYFSLFSAAFQLTTSQMAEKYSALRFWY